MEVIEICFKNSINKTFTNHILKMFLKMFLKHFANGPLFMFYEHLKNILRETLKHFNNILKIFYTKPESTF